MAYNRRTDRYVSEENVGRWEDIVRENIYQSEIVDYLLNNWFDIDNKATFLYDIAHDYEVELTEEEED